MESLKYRESGLWYGLMQIMLWRRKLLTPREGGIQGTTKEPVNSQISKRQRISPFSGQKSLIPHWKFFWCIACIFINLTPAKPQSPGLFSVVLLIKYLTLYEKWALCIILIWVSLEKLFLRKHRFPTHFLQSVAFSA